MVNFLKEFVPVYTFSFLFICFYNCPVLIAWCFVLFNKKERDQKKRFAICAAKSRSKALATGLRTPKSWSEKLFTNHHFRSGLRNTFQFAKWYTTRSIRSSVMNRKIHEPVPKFWSKSNDSGCELQNSNLNQMICDTCSTVLIWIKRFTICAPKSRSESNNLWYTLRSSNWNQMISVPKSRSEFANYHFRSDMRYVIRIERFETVNHLTYSVESVCLFFHFLPLYDTGSSRLYWISSLVLWH